MLIQDGGLFNALSRGSWLVQGLHLPFLCIGPNPHPRKKKYFDNSLLSVSVTMQDLRIRVFHARAVIFESGVSNWGEKWINGLCLLFLFSFIQCSLACRCAEAARKRGFKVFGLQNYGECWSGAGAENTYNRDNSSSNCIMFLSNPSCDVNNPQECAGKENVNYVYSLGG